MAYSIPHSSCSIAFAPLPFQAFTYYNADFLPENKP